MAAACAGLEGVHAQGQAVNQGQLLLVPGLGPFSKRYGGWGLAKASYCLF